MPHSFIENKEKKKKKLRFKIKIFVGFQRNPRLKISFKWPSNESIKFHNNKKQYKHFQD